VTATRWRSSTRLGASRSGDAVEITEAGEAAARERANNRAAQSAEEIVPGRVSGRQLERAG